MVEVDKIEDELYYIQSLGYVGNCLLWWKKGGSGYTCNLDDAGIFSMKEASALTSREEDIFWPKDYVDSVVERHVDCQDLDPSKKVLFK